MRINGWHLKNTVAESVRLLEMERDILNRINVFPVADGDTGTNLYITLKGTWDHILDLEDHRASIVAQAMADAAIRSAKGNSGVIFSQFLWGFREGVDGKEYLGARDLAVALATGADYAYRSVANPVEGTILTVMKETARWASRLSLRLKNVRDFIVEVFREGTRSLERTPDLLARLGKPRVVDSGAYGFILFLEGLVRAIGGRVSHRRYEGNVEVKEERGTGLYCSNFLLLVKDPSDLSDLKKVLSSMGDSIVVVGGGEYVKVHIHTSEPEAVRKILGEMGDIEQERVEPI